MLGENEIVHILNALNRVAVTGLDAQAINLRCANILQNQLKEAQNANSGTGPAASTKDDETNAEG